MKLKSHRYETLLMIRRKRKNVAGEKKKQAGIFQRITNHGSETLGKEYTG